MTMVQVVQKLVKEGNKVKYYKRTDGGILITELNGVKYHGASGNAVARQMTGTTLSEAKEKQLKAITPNIPKYTKKQFEKLSKIEKAIYETKKKKTVERKKGYQKFSKEIEEQLKETQKVWRKERNNNKDGRITREKVRWNIEHLGEQETLSRLKKATKYAKGLAYEGNVEALADRVLSFSFGIENGGIKTKAQIISQAIRFKKDEFKDEWIWVCNDILYEAEKPDKTDKDKDDALNEIIKVTQINLR